MHTLRSTIFSVSLLFVFLSGCGPGTAERVTPVPRELLATPQLFKSSDFQRGSDGVPTLTVLVPSPQEGEQIALLLANVDGPDKAQVTVTANGTTPVASIAPLLQASALANALEQEAPRDTWTMHEAMRQRNEATVRDFFARGRQGARSNPSKSASAALVPSLPLPPNWNFCVEPPGGTLSKRAAVLKKESATVGFYVDAADASFYAPYENLPTGENIWDRLANAWESQIYGNITGTFGPPSDVDGNGKLLVFFSSALDVATTGTLMGYYWSGDVIYARDANCTGTGSNGADMFYMNGLSALIASPSTWTADFVINVQYPSTLAHEFQHLINFNQHCPNPSTCAVNEDAWLNEGLSMVAEDVAGFGWNPVTYTPYNGTPVTETNVSSAKLYLTRSQNFPAKIRGGYHGYDQTSLTIWEGDPIGNYEGVHSWFRYFGDRFGTGLLTTLASGQHVGIDNFERASGLTFSQALSDFTMAMMFSNEGILPAAPNSPYDLQGANWTPFHTKLRYLDYATLTSTQPATTTLRVGGWNAYLVGIPQPFDPNQSVSFTVRGNGTTPWVSVVRFKGTLPR